MPCPFRAVVLVTHDMKGTSSSVAKERLELTCMGEDKHSGPHKDAKSGITWDDKGKLVAMFLRHEDEPMKDYYQ